MDLPKIPASAFPARKRIGGAVSPYVITLAAVNFVAVILQCGIGQCHTMGYALL